ncbi:hypothetical protein KJ785_01340 [Patescibacteria group bacterium]|nr:hypothetical protein [Patescibacteria group bacterium]
MKISYQKKIFSVRKKIIDRSISAIVLLCLITLIMIPNNSQSFEPVEETLIFRPNIVEGTWVSMENIKYINLESVAGTEKFDSSNSTYPNSLLNYTKKELGLKPDEEIVLSELDLLSETTSSTQDLEQIESVSTAPATSTEPLPNSATTSEQTILFTTTTKTTTTTTKAIIIPNVIEKTEIVTTTNTATTTEPLIEEEEIVEEEKTEPIVETPTSPLLSEPEIDSSSSTPTSSIESVSLWNKSINWLKDLIIIKKALAQADPTANTEDLSTTTEIPAEDLEKEKTKYNKKSTKLVEIINEITTSPAEEKTVEQEQETSVEEKKVEFNSSTENNLVEYLDETLIEETSDYTEEEIVEEEIVEENVEEDEEPLPIKPEQYLIARDFSNTSAKYYPYETLLKNARLGISMANKLAENHLVVVYYRNTRDFDQNWKKLKNFKLKINRSNQENNGFFYIDLDNIEQINDLRNLQIKLDYEGYSREPQEPILIDALWLEAQTDVSKIIQPSEDIIKLISTQKDFSLEDEPIMIFSVDKEKIRQKNNKKTIDKIKQVFKNKKEELANIKIKINTEAVVEDDEGRILNSIEPDIYTDEVTGVLTVAINKNKRKFRPGKYKLAVKIYQEDYNIEYEQDFTWGVLALNTNKGEYLPNEQVYLQMAALDNTGHTLCDANLSLIIIEPNNIESNILIEKSSECGPNNVIQVPDYYAFYIPTQIGTYSVRLLNMDTSQEITENFKVENQLTFDVERIGPTRIYPPADYEMILKIKVNKNFYGQFQEIVPNNFVINNIQINQLSGYFNSTDNPEFSVNAGVTETYITANVDWKKGDIYEIRYTFDAPNISPYLFLLGPIGLSSMPQYQTVATTTQVSSSTLITTSTVDLSSVSDFEIDLKDLVGTYLTTYKTVPTTTVVMVEPSMDDFTGTYTEFRKWQIASDEVATINPNGNGTLGCTPTPGGSANYAIVADFIYYPTTGDTSDYVSCGVGESDSYEMTTFSNVSSTTEIEVWSYYINGKVNDRFQVELWNSAETVQYGTTQQLANSISNVWNSVTFSGLNLTQAQLDDMRIKYYAYKTQSPETGSVLYSTYASVTYTPLNAAPSVSNVLLNSGANIILQANTTTAISATGVVSDTSGYGDITQAVAKIYRSNVTGAEACTVNDNRCYEVIPCSPSGCSGNSCNVTCTADIWFHADPTDTGTPWASEYWRAWIEATDTLSQTGSAYSPADSPDMQSLSSISLEGEAINFGNLAPGEQTSILTNNTKIISTGNTSLDIIIYGTDIVNILNPSSTIPVGNITFATATNTPFASSTPLSLNPGMEIEFDMPKNTTSSTLSSSMIWWGVEIPPIKAGIYKNTITYSSLINELPWP